jgi:hypothetical protein
MVIRFVVETAQRTVRPSISAGYSGAGPQSALPVAGLRPGRRPEDDQSS